MNSKLNRFSAGIAWLKARGFKVVDASGPNGTYQNLREFDRRTLGQAAGGSHKVTAQAIGAEGQDGGGSHKVTAQAIGAEGQDGGGGKVSVHGVGGEGQDAFHDGRLTTQAIGTENQF